MKHIVAPWRMAFIRKARHGHKCIFCGLKGRRHDARSRKMLYLYFGRTCFVMMNRYPYNNGHLMVVPYVHEENLAKLTPAAQQEMMKLTGESLRILKKALGCDGANCGMNMGKVAGAGIADHVHMHVVPRWTGDSNFFPIIADTKSMPEYLEKTFDRLKPHFDRLKSLK